MKTKKNQENFLDYIPKHNALFPYEKKENGNIEIKMLNKGLAKKITQLLFKKPKYTYVELEQFGSFIWEQIDGQRTVFEIGKLVKDKFGQDAEPLYERLTEYIQILRRNRFIVYVNLQK